MGLIIFISVVALIAILAYLVAYITSGPAIPPYQEPVEEAKQDIDANWPFPTSKRP